MKIIYLFYPHNIFHPSNQAAPLSYFPSHVTKANKRGQMHKLRYCMASPIPPHQCKPQHNPYRAHPHLKIFIHTHKSISPKAQTNPLHYSTINEKPFFNRPIQTDQNQNPNPSTRFVIFHSRLKPLNFKRTYIPILHCCDITPTAIAHSGLQLLP